MVSGAIELEKTLRGQYIVGWVIWIVMCLSVLFWLFIVHSVLPTEGNIKNVDPEQLKTVLGVVAVIALIISYFVGSWAKSDGRVSASVKGKLPVIGPMAAIYSQLPEKEARALLAVNAYFSAWMIALALSEAAAVLGFALAFQLHEPTLIYPFVLGALVVNLFLTPGNKIVEIKAKQALERFSSTNR